MPFESDPLIVDRPLDPAQMKNTQQKTMKSYITLKQRITAAVTAVVMLAQIFIPTVALATTAWSGNFESRIANELNSPMIELINDPAAPETYKGAYFIHKSTINHTTLDSFYSEYKGGKPAQKPKFIGDSFVQSRLIRAQYRALMGRYFFSGVLRVEEVEAEAITNLYSAAKNYAEGSNLTLGTPLGNTSSAPDMIWPELRQINGKSYLVPVVHLTDKTIADGKWSGHLIEFNSNAEFAGIQLDFATLVTGYNSTIVGLGGIINNSGTIKSPGNLTLSSCEKTPQPTDPQFNSSINTIRCGGTVANLGGTIDVGGVLKIYTQDYTSKTLLIPYKDKNGEGTKFGRVADVKASGVEIYARNNIDFVGANLTSSGRALLDAGKNINILPQQTSGSSQSQEGDWEVNKNTTNLLMSRLAAEDTLSLIAGGVINITASELISSRGGIELLAGEGIHILDELEQTSIQKEDRKGKTKGTSSEFRTEAVRAILNAGKGVLLDSEHGDVVLRATKLTSTEGTQVTARNGKVQLLMTKELEEFHLQTVKKSTWTIKTHTQDVEHEKNIQNAIVGGLQVQAKYAINVEYTGKEDADLKQQVDEYRNIPGMEWMGQVYDSAFVDKSGDPNAPSIKGEKINWEAVEEVHRELKKTKRNLSPAAMAIIAIAVAVAMGPVGAQIVGSSGGGLSAAIVSAAPNATIGAALSAGATVIVTQATQSLAAGNSLSDTLSALDSSESLKSLAIAMATAGAMQHTDIDMFTKAADSKNLAVSLAGQAGQAVVDSTVRAGISVTINGGSSADYLNAFKANLATGAVEILGEKMANKIGLAYDEGNGNITNTVRYIAHAGAGCVYGMASAAATGDSGNEKYSCFSGAGGAVIGELVADQFKDHHQIAERQKATEEWLEDLGISEENNIAYEQLTDTQKRIMKETMPANFISAAQLNDLRKTGVDLAKLGAGLAAFVAKADVDIAASAGANAAEHNAFPLVIYGAMLALSALSTYLLIEDTIELGQKLTDDTLTEAQKEELIEDYAINAGVSIGLTLAGMGALKAIEKLIEVARASGKSADVIAELEKVKDSVSKGEQHSATDNNNLAAIPIPPLRQQYIDEVLALKDLGFNLRAAGMTAEDVARQLHALRRDLGVEYKDLTPPDKLAEIYQRNLQKYGDKLGPSIEWLRANGKSWEQIIESSSRPGGKDLQF